MREEDKSNIRGGETDIDLYPKTILQPPPMPKCKPPKGENMLVTLEQVKTFEVKFANNTVLHMKQKSEWNGLIELESDKGDKLIVMPTESSSNHILNQFFGVSNTFKVIKASPNLLIL